MNLTVTVSRRRPCDRSESRSSSGPLAARGPLAGPAAGCAAIGMRRRVGPLRAAQLLRSTRCLRSPKGLAAGRCRDVHATTCSSCSESRSSSGPIAVSDPQRVSPTLAAGGDEMCMRRRIAPAARARPVVLDSWLGPRPAVPLRTTPLLRQLSTSARGVGFDSG